MDAAQATGWIGYGVWLLAGAGDFACHRRSGIAVTSGARESALHLLQMGLVGTGLLLWLAFAPTPALIVALAALVALHSVAAYVDTRSAYGVRAITPVEQHLHSVLDAAPVVAVTALALAWRQTDPGDAWFVLQPRAPAVWLATIAPAIALAGIPALAEWRSTLRARRDQAGRAIISQKIARKQANAGTPSTHQTRSSLK